MICCSVALAEAPYPEWTFPAWTEADEEVARLFQEAEPIASNEEAVERARLVWSMSPFGQALENADWRSRTMMLGTRSTFEVVAALPDGTELHIDLYRDGSGVNILEWPEQSPFGRSRDAVHLYQNDPKQAELIGYAVRFAEAVQPGDIARATQWDASIYDCGTEKYIVLEALYGNEFDSSGREFVFQYEPLFRLISYTYWNG